MFYPPNPGVLPPVVPVSLSLSLFLILTLSSSSSPFLFITRRSYPSASFSPSVSSTVHTTLGIFVDVDYHAANLRDALSIINGAISRSRHVPSKRQDLIRIIDTSRTGNALPAIAWSWRNFQHDAEGGHTYLWHSALSTLSLRCQPTPRLHVYPQMRFAFVGDIIPTCISSFALECIRNACLASAKPSMRSIM